MRRLVVRLSLSGLLPLLFAPAAHGWSGGPVFNVTDLNPTCAVCHSSVSKDNMRFVPAGFATSQLAENRHYKLIEDGQGPYQAMSPADRQRLLADVKAADDNASVTISVPATVRPGQQVEIVATVKGGHGVQGVVLIDTDDRYQSRPIQGDGWVVVGAPKIVGSGGKEQTKWVESRGQGLKKNVNSAVLFDQKADLAARTFPEGKVTWTVKAPQEPGTYTVAAAFFHGTEKASPVGGVTNPAGQTNPRGGAFGPSGRIRFAKPVTVTVR